MKVERKAAGHMMRHDSLMHVHRALGLAGGSAGEMKQREILGIGLRDLEIVARLVHQLMEIFSVWNRANLFGAADQQHMLEPGYRGAQVGDFAFVQQGGGHQHTAIADADPLTNRFRAEGGEERAEDVAFLQRSERADIKFGNTPGEDKHPLALAETEASQHIRKTVGEQPQVGI